LQVETLQAKYWVSNAMGRLQLLHCFHVFPWDSPVIAGRV
jgi:hypothetical protein